MEITDSSKITPLSKLTTTSKFDTLMTVMAGPSSRAVEGVGLRPLAC